MSMAKLRAGTITLGIGCLLIVAILSVALYSALSLRQRETELWKTQLAALSLVLADQAYQSMSSAQLALDSIAERINGLNFRDDADLRRRGAGADIHGMLKDKISGLPQADVATLVAANGDVVNFTRSHPPPRINLADRDYFRLRRDLAQDDIFISLPVRNKGNGKWVFYLSKRLNDGQGRFLGLVLVGLSVDGFTDFYQRLGQNLGDGASVSLSRSDFALLTRWPRREEMIGQINASGTNHLVVADLKKKADVVLLDTPRMMAYNQPVTRLAAVRVLDRYPLIVNVSVTDDLYLASWRNSVKVIASLALGSALALAVGVVFLLNLFKRREQADAALSRSSAEIEDLYRNAPCGYHSLDADGRFLRCNDTQLNWLGYRRDELVGKMRISEILTRDSRDDFQAGFDRFKQIGWIRDLEIDFVRKDGSVLPAIISATAIFDEQGRYISSRSTVFDQTEHKRMLRREQARTAVLEKLAQSVALPEVLTAITNSFEQEFPDWRGEIQLADNLANTVTATTTAPPLHAEPITDSVGHQVGYFAVYPRQSQPGPQEPPTDKVLIQQAAYLAGIAIEHHRAETEIRDLNQGLERRVQERTEDLKNANAQLERANAELEAFAYSTSHDLRAPLRAINGYASILADTERDKLSLEGQHMLERIAANANRLGELIDDILNYARAGRRALNREAVDPAKVAQSVVEQLQESFPHTVIRIEAMPMVRSDATMLYQILHNLLNNACKFSALREQPEVAVGVQQPADEQTLSAPIFFVRDNGVGFEMQYAGKLFTMFEKLHSDRHMTGSGVGLAIVKRLVERHGGKVWAEARPDQGATFFFTLPDEIPPPVAKALAADSTDG